MSDALTLVIGLVAAAAGGEFFVRGSVGIASWLRVPPGIIGLTVAAFATSSPELAVSISAARQGDTAIALGNALGSNAVNVGLVLGIALLIAPLKVADGSARRDYPLAILAPIVTLVLALDGMLTRLDGAILLGLFVVWLGTSLRAAYRHRLDATADVLGEHNRGRALGEAIVGLVLLVAAGKWIITGSVGLASAIGLDPFVVGATLVAAGTSMPELATTIAAGLRGHEEVGLGTILGSNLFNGLLIVGLAVVLAPAAVQPVEIVSSTVFGAILVALILPGPGGLLPRRRGVLLLAMYAAYLAVVIQYRPGSG